MFYSLMERVRLTRAIRSSTHPAPSKIKMGPSRPILIFIGGEGEIRTHEPRKGPPVFKTGAFNRSATSPAGCGAILPDKIHLRPAAKPLNRGHLGLISV